MNGGAMFDVVMVIFALCAALTLLREYWRAGRVTLLFLLTMGNIFYGALTPVLAYYAPGSTPVFNTYVTQAGMTVNASGLTQVMIGATLFQLACLVVAWRGARRAGAGAAQATGDDARIIAAAIHVGWIMLLLGVVGAVWLGLIYNGSPWGVYQIAYAERSPLFRANSTQAFLLLLGMYGASQLVVAFLMAKRVKAAALILLLVTLHGIGIKSKFPIFWILFIFLIAAIGEKVRVRRLIFPIGVAISVLFAMSVLRSLENASGLDEYMAASEESAVHFWENDIPGPASISYFVINQENIEHTWGPLLEVPMLLIPRLVYDRGATMPEIWAAQMLGSEYEPGLGFGWSLLCDGYLLGGWLGVMFLAYAVAGLARYMGGLVFSRRSTSWAFGHVMVYTCAPIFFLGFRESFAGLIKALLIMAAILWAPTALRVGLGKRRVRHRETA